MLNDLGNLLVDACYRLGVSHLVPGDADLDGRFAADNVLVAAARSGPWRSACLLIAVFSVLPFPFAPTVSGSETDVLLARIAAYGARRPVRFCCLSNLPGNSLVGMSWWLTIGRLRG